MIAIYKEDMSFSPLVYYVYEEESRRFYLTADPSFSYSYKEVMKSDDFIVIEKEKVYEKVGV